MAKVKKPATLNGATQPAPAQKVDDGLLAELTKQQVAEALAKAEKASFDELGSTGLNRYGGVVNEEFLPELTGLRGIKKYREMADNDPTVGAVLYAIRMIARNVKWRVEGDEDAAEFIDGCLSDMSSTWQDTLEEILSVLTFGFSFHEIIYKRRTGPSDDGAKRSRFTDGKIGWRKLPIRSQDSLFEWKFDDEGGIAGFVQGAVPPQYKIIEIPINRGLLFRIGMHKGNPEGRSILRSAYRPWFFKKNIEEIEGVGIERDLAGLPMIMASPDYIQKHEANLKKILKNVRRDAMEGLLLPMMRDGTGNLLLEFKLLNSGGQRQINITQVIDRYDKRIAMTALADFILLGQQAVGSFALASSKTAIFAAALGAILQSIAEVLNRYAIPRLLAINGMQVEEPPRLVPGDIESQDLQELAAYLGALAAAGMPLFPNPKLQRALLEVADLPVPTPEEEEAATQQQTQPPVPGLPPVTPPPAPPKSKPAPSTEEGDMSEGNQVS